MRGPLLSVLLLLALLGPGCGPTVTEAEVKELFAEALDRWEEAYRGRDDRRAVPLGPHLEEAARQRGRKSWAAFRTEAVASMGEKRWEELWSDLAALQTARLETLLEEVGRPGFPPPVPDADAFRAAWKRAVDRYYEALRAAGPEDGPPEFESFLEEAAAGCGAPDWKTLCERVSDADGQAYRDVVEEMAEYTNRAAQDHADAVAAAAAGVPEDGGEPRKD